MKHLIIDGMNFLHRARAGFQAGPHPLMFNFYRNLRALVALHRPDKVYYVLEGHPKSRHEALPEYKANREITVDDPAYEKKVDEMKRFFAGHADVLELMMKCFPITVMRHPHHECDDVIGHLVSTFCDEKGVVEREHVQDEVVVSSSDSDFIQLLQRYHGVALYNPTKKAFVEAPEYDYLVWKALRGDPTDNIPGIPGCGDKTATKIALGCVQDPTLGKLVGFLQESPERLDVYQRNHSLMTFHDFSEDDLKELEQHSGAADWSEARRVFDSYGFKSITNDKSWKKFVETFDGLAR